jgi:ectoine hydroxylase-related dioxygenase (phytanoyl-CoA dioxygenase family)
MSKKLRGRLFVNSLSNKNLLTKEQIQNYHENGYLILKNFYDVPALINPITKQLYNLFRIIIKSKNLKISIPTFTEDALHDVYLKILFSDRKLGSIIYDAVKQIPEFLSLVSASCNRQLVRELLNSENIGIAGGGFGIRINNPKEEKFLAGWHQEYPAQLRSIDGIVFWAPLVNVSKDMGPVVLCPKSHINGVYKMKISNDLSIPAAYQLKIMNECSVLSSFDQIAPCTSPGDLILMNFLTLHRSGINVSNKALWSMQFRYFNFENSEGQKIDWMGSYISGIKFENIYPDLIEREK